METWIYEFESRVELLKTIYVHLPKLRIVLELHTTDFFSLFLRIMKLIPFPKQGLSKKKLINSKSDPQKQGKVM